jgi:hypothetical protein
MNRTRTVATGLVIAGLLGLSDIVSLPFSDGEHPPWVIAIAGAVLGLITVVGVGFAWRGSRGGAVAAIVTRLLSALTAVPALFVDGVPSGLRVAATVGILVTLLSITLIAVGLSRQQEPSYTAR